MIGAVAGDMIGSVYEFRAMKRKDFEPLFAVGAELTDDTVLTVAVADALMNDRDPAESLRDWGRRYPACSWGGMFRQWLFSDDMGPYDSFGNGAAMRVSSAGFLADSLDDAWTMSDRVTAVTHNHPEGMKGARAVATAIVLARQGAAPDEIRTEIATRFGYDMDRTVDEIRPDYCFDESCQRTVPEALVCALAASDLEDAIRNAVSLGGDADTLGAIAGAVAEALFGLPAWMEREVGARLPDEMRGVLSAMYRRRGMDVF